MMFNPTPASTELFAEICDRRGIEPSVMFEIMCRHFAVKEFLFGLQDNMPFGKYKGLRIEDIIRADPSYIRWLCGESDKFDLSKAAWEFLLDFFPIKGDVSTDH